MPATRTAQPGRARPMAPAERRAVIVAAAVPLVRQHGVNTTTRQIATAAGIAEGTLFRAFDDKDAIIDAVIDTVLDADPWVAEIRRIDPDLPLDRRLLAAIGILQQRIGDVFEVMMAIGRTRPQKVERLRQPQPTPQDQILQAMAELIAPDAGQLRVPVDEACQILRAVTMAGAHPFLADGHPLSAADVVSTVLDGIRRRAADPTEPARSAEGSR